MCEAVASQLTHPILLQLEPGSPAEPPLPCRDCVVHCQSLHPIQWLEQALQHPSLTCSLRGTPVPVPALLPVDMPTTAESQHSHTL